jgi:pre-mRNA-splicing helicase BRR2
MKALVAEIARNISQRLASMKINVCELTGDTHKTKKNIDDTQIIIATPEKWDIVTRKSGDGKHTNLVKLLIIDEIHILHDDRGPVIESIVGRTIRQTETSREMTRIVGLSATLPNFEDVAIFLRVKPDHGLFYFDNSYRPCPLKQIYLGIIVRKPLQRCRLIEDICCEKVKERVGKYQVIIFVETRKGTVKTADKINQDTAAKCELEKFMQDHATCREILRLEAPTLNNNELSELVPFGLAVHHAGLSKTDRTFVEDLFSDGNIQVLVSTSTLAWGVNLPAHTVIIKGTRVYNPAKGMWDELSMLDVMQMFGRAGRPQYDKFGEGLIITGHSDLQFYLSLFNQQLPIESRYISYLPDHLNAEIVLGNISNLKEAACWLGYTYCYTRILRSKLNLRFIRT